MTERTVKSFSKLKLSLAIGVPKWIIGSFISILFGKDFRKNFPNTKATRLGGFVIDRLQQIFTSYTICGKIQLSEGRHGYSLCTKVHKKGVATMTTSEVLQLLELLAVVIFGILNYLKHQ